MRAGGREAGSGGETRGGGCPRVKPDRSSERRVGEAVAGGTGATPLGSSRFVLGSAGYLQRAAKAEQNRTAGYRVVNNDQCPGSQSFEHHGEPLFR